jgi:hypothetical protein
MFLPSLSLVRSDNTTIRLMHSYDEKAAEFVGLRLFSGAASNRATKPVNAFILPGSLRRNAAAFCKSSRSCFNKIFANSDRRFP